ncbi:MAG: hypothetical protein H0V07_10315 [Propionibacteriales bacterium]|nr:hypothetical protein [Propionibacteriales bacterium]
MPDVDQQFTRLVEAWNHDLIAAQIRRCGRQAGERLGYKIRTVASGPSSEKTDTSWSGWS